MRLANRPSPATAQSALRPQRLPTSPSAHPTPALGLGIGERQPYVLGIPSPSLQPHLTIIGPIIERTQTAGTDYRSSPHGSPKRSRPRIPRRLKDTSDKAAQADSRHSATRSGYFELGPPLNTGWVGAQSKWRSVWLHRERTQLAEGMSCGGIHRPHSWLHRPGRTPLRPTSRNPYVRSHDQPNQYIEQLLLSIAQRDRGVPLSKHELIGRRCLSDPCHTPGLRGADRGLGVHWWRRKPNPVGLKCQRCVEPHRGWHAWLDGRRG